MSFYEFLVLVAILAGPIIAVFITRGLDAKRERANRRWQIFSTLMGYRRSRLSKEYVTALNLVEVEFHDVPKVLAEWKKLMELFKQSNFDRTDDSAVKRWTDDVDKQNAILLSAIADSEGVKVQQLDVFSGGYFPVAWHKNENEQKESLAAMNEMFKTLNELASRNLAEKDTPNDS